VLHNKIEPFLKNITKIDANTIPDDLRYSIKHIDIPSSVTEICRWSFSGCTSLKSITIPDSVTTIGGEAFLNCESLQSITIPNSVTKIG
jgi:hypothetical protein